MPAVTTLTGFAFSCLFSRCLGNKIVKAKQRNLQKIKASYSGSLLN